MPQLNKPTTSGRVPSREGKVNISSWHDPAFKAGLRAIQVQNDQKIEQLIEEALTDLFSKYEVKGIKINGIKAKGGKSIK